MGGCVASILSAQSRASEVPVPLILEQRKAHFGAKVTEDKPHESGIYQKDGKKTFEQITDEYQGEKKSDGLRMLLLDRLKLICEKYPTKKAAAWRTVESIEKTEMVDDKGRKKPWDVFHLSSSRYLTFAEFYAKVTHFGAGLRTIGLDAGAMIGIYENTRMEWLASCIGLWTQQMVGVTVYANLGDEALVDAVAEAEMKAVVCNASSVSKFVKLLKNSGKITTLPIIVYIDDLPVNVDVGEARLHSWKDVVKKGKAALASGEVSLNPNKSIDDLAIVMYTSGTTGKPKGIMMSHGNLNAACKALTEHFNTIEDALFPNQEDNVYLGYLPLAHIMEFAAEFMVLLKGWMIGYGNPRTLTDVSAKPHGDLKEHKPVFLVGAPRVYDTIKKVIESKIPPGFKRAIFERAYKDRLDGYKRGVATPYWDKRVFGPIKALLGGRIQVVLSGGAPLSAKTQEFLSVVFGLSVGQGYGLSETGAALCLPPVWDLAVGSVGQLVGTVQAKLVDVEGWSHTDKPEPRGELCVRGPNVFKGYYKQPKVTAEVMMDDGWFRTGDVASITSRGTFRIVGRVKALAKNAFGEYIALESLESIYTQHKLCVPMGTCIVVDPQKPYIVALVCTTEKNAMDFAEEVGIKGTWPQILKDSEFHRKAAELLAKVGAEHGLKPFEQVKYVRLLADEWTPENGMHTAVSKLVRREIEKKYAKEIAELFSDPG